MQKMEIEEMKRNLSRTQNNFEKLQNAPVDDSKFQSERDDFELLIAKLRHDIKALTNDNNDYR